MYIISRATLQRVTLPPRLHDVSSAAMMIELFVCWAVIRIEQPQQPRSAYCPNQFIYFYILN